MRHLTAYRFSVKKFDRMCAVGLFEDEKVELLGGVLTKMTTKPPHDYAVNALRALWDGMLPKGKWSVRTEQPVHLGRFWKPMPDVAVVRGLHQDYVSRTPGPADVALIVEVSDTTYAKDTKIKLRRYERCGLPYFWVVDLNRRRVEVREMGASGLAVPVFYEENEEVPVVLNGQECGRLAVRDMLP